MFTLKANSKRLNHLAFFPDGRHLAVGGESEGVYVWDLTERSLLRQHGGKKGWQIKGLAVPPDASVILAILEEHLFRIDLSQPQSAPWTSLIPHSASLHLAHSLALSPQGDRLALFRTGIEFYTYPEMTSLWTALTPGGHWRKPLVFTPDGTHLLASEGKEVLMFACDTGQQARILVKSPLDINKLAISPDGKRLAMAAQTKLFVHASDGTHQRTFLTGNRKTFQCLDFHPTRPLLLAGSSDGTARIYDLTTGQEQSFDWGTGAALDVGFSPDGMRAACCGQKGKIVIWDVD